MNNSLYIHIPFCRQKCGYCDFYSIPYHRDLASAYVDSLCQQIESVENKIATIYIGGGTPTILDLSFWKKLFKSLNGIVSDACEFTVEANPESVVYDKLKLFLDSGVNRMSFGLQSFNDDKLEILGRVHRSAQGLKSIEMAVKAGFKNIGVDLIFGVPGETLNKWEQELNHAVTLPIQHISAYALTCEENTPLFLEVKNNKVSLPDDTIVAKMYKITMDFLAKRQFMQYEVSNYAKEGYYCRHNMNYWENNAYLGLGTSAVSYVDGVRQRNISDVDKYIAYVRGGKTPVVFREKLSCIQRAKETAALKIRTKAGILLKDFRRKTKYDLIELERKILNDLVCDGFVSYRKKRGEIIGISLTKKGFLFADTVSSGFL